jgi:surface antigen
MRLNMKNVTFAAIAICLLSASCSQKNIDGTRTSGINKADGGAVIGGVGGAVAGSQLGKGQGRYGTAIGGGLLGAFAGHSIGSAFDEPDTSAYKYNNARPANVSLYQDILEYSQTGQTSDWQNINGRMVQVTPVRTYTNNNGQDCRDFIITHTNDSQSSGSACRDAKGVWY